MKKHIGVALFTAFTATAVNAEVWECPDIKGGKVLGNFESRSEMWRCPQVGGGERLSGNGGPGCVLMKSEHAQCRIVSSAPSTQGLMRVGMTTAEVEDALGSPMHKLESRDTATWTYRHVPSPYFELTFHRGSLKSWRRKR